MISELAVGYSSSNKNYLSVMEVNRSDISKNEFSVPNGQVNVVFGQIEQLDVESMHYNFANIDKYVLNSDIFQIFRD